MAEKEVGRYSWVLKNGHNEKCDDDDFVDGKYRCKDVTVTKKM